MGTIQFLVPEKLIIFGGFYLKKKGESKFKKTNVFLIDLEWSILAKGKVAISKTVPTAQV